MHVNPDSKGYFNACANFGTEIGILEPKMTLGPPNWRFFKIYYFSKLYGFYHKDHYTLTKQLHYDLKILMVSDEYKLSMAKFAYKQQHKLLPGGFENHYTKVQDTHNHTTRQKDLLKIGNYSQKTRHSEMMSAIAGAKI